MEIAIPGIAGCIIARDVGILKFEEVRKKYCSGQEILVTDKIKYYSAKIEYCKNKFMQPTSDHHKERRLKRKWIAATIALDEWNEELSRESYVFN